MNKESETNKKLVYFISDTHFYHDKIISYSRRPFKDLNHMHEEIIRRWNKRVKAQDEVYFLGDLALYGHTEEVIDILKRLKGKKHLVKGNHDNWMFRENNKHILDYFEEVFPQRHILELDGKRLYLQHRVLTTQQEKVPKRCNFFIYGHTHGILPAVADNNKFLNVSVETLNYTPRTLSELERFNEKQKRRTY